MRTLFLRTVCFLLPLLFSGTVWAQGGGIDTSTVPEGFRPYVHLLGSAEVVAPQDGPDWRSMDIKDYDQDRKKYRELEEMVLAVWPSVQIITVMLDTLRPTFLSGIESVPTDTLRAHRQEVKDGQAQAKADRKEERKEKKARKKEAPSEAPSETPSEEDEVTIAIGEKPAGPVAAGNPGRIDGLLAAVHVPSGRPAEIRARRHGGALQGLIIGRRPRAVGASFRLHSPGTCTRPGKFQPDCPAPRCP